MLLQVLTTSAFISTVQNMLRDALPSRFREEASAIEITLRGAVSASSILSSEQRCQHVRGAQHEAKRLHQDTRSWLTYSRGSRLIIMGSSHHGETLYGPSVLAESNGE